MLRNTTLNLPDDLVARAKSYAAAHGTTMTAIIREHLETVTSDGTDPVTDDPLLTLAFRIGGRRARNQVRLGYSSGEAAAGGAADRRLTDRLSGAPASVRWAAPVAV